MNPVLRHLTKLLNGILDIVDLAVVRRSSLTKLVEQNFPMPPTGEPAVSQTSQAQFLRLAGLFTPLCPITDQKIRVGRAGDGGYVMLDRFGSDSTVFSFGIDREVSWDADMAARGFDVYMFDHTVSGPPVTNPRFHFFKKMIAPTESSSTASIEGLLRDFGSPGPNNILKIDIEGSEWDIFDTTSLSELERFSQITCEFHYFSKATDLKWLDQACRVMEKLTSSFAVVHVHGNNYTPYSIIHNIPFPEVIEVTLVNKSMFEIGESNDVFPGELDHPNYVNRPDIYLGLFKFPAVKCN